MGKTNIMYMYDAILLQHEEDSGGCTEDCWQFLATISDHQFISKTGEINKLLAHMLLLLT